MTETSWKRGDNLMGLHNGLPTSFWRRMLVLWSLAPVPFFAALDDEVDSMEERKDAASVGRGSSGCSGRGRAFCRTRRR